MAGAGRRGAERQGRPRAQFASVQRDLRHHRRLRARAAARGRGARHRAVGRTRPLASADPDADEDAGRRGPGPCARRGSAASPAARLHSMLLAAETLRATGKADPASERLSEAARLVPADVRAAVALAARALTRSEPIDFAEAPRDAGATASILGALDSCMRMRGHEGERTQSAGAPSATELLFSTRQKLDAGDVGAAAPVV